MGRVDRIPLIQQDLESGPDELLFDLPERHLVADPPVEDFNHPEFVVPHPIYDPDRPHLEAVAGEYAYTPPG